MKARCSGCAFTAGTLASRDRFVAIKTHLALVADVPFFCHANAVEDEIPDGEARVCKGYLDAQAQMAPVSDTDRDQARAVLAALSQVDGALCGVNEDAFRACGAPVMEVP